MSFSDFPLWCNNIYQLSAKTVHWDENWASLLTLICISISLLSPRYRTFIPEENVEKIWKVQNIIESFHIHAYLYPIFRNDIIHSRKINQN